MNGVALRRKETRRFAATNNDDRLQNQRLQSTKQGGVQRLDVDDAGHDVEGQEGII